MTFHNDYRWSSSNNKSPGYQINLLLVPGCRNVMKRTSFIRCPNKGNWVSLVLQVSVPPTNETCAYKWCFNHMRTFGHRYIVKDKKKKGKAIPVTGHEGPYGSETLRLPHFLDSWLTDGSEVVSPTHWPPFTPQEDSCYSFPLEAELTSGP
jgi:hypothetical protein